jgi:predicted small lipoprotein YifL
MLITARQLRVLLTAVIVVCTTAAGGCGQKGPLYLPEPPPEEEPAAPEEAVPGAPVIPEATVPEADAAERQLEIEDMKRQTVPDEEREAQEEAEEIEQPR